MLWKWNCVSVTVSNSKTSQLVRVPTRNLTNLSLVVLKRSCNVTHNFSQCWTWRKDECVQIFDQFYVVFYILSYVVILQLLELSPAPGLIIYPNELTGSFGFFTVLNLKKRWMCSNIWPILCCILHSFLCCYSTIAWALPGPWVDNLSQWTYRVIWISKKTWLNLPGHLDQ